jgi:hypothetical protein
MNYSEKYSKTLKEYIATHNAIADGSVQLALLQSIKRRGLHTPTDLEKKTLADCHGACLKPMVK